jgi:PII-like signaling protein
VNGCSLRFYMHENQKHRGRLLHEWLLEQARKSGVRGGSAFRAITGFGRHGVISEQHFFELAGQATIMVDFAVSDSEAETLLALAREDGAALFYVRAAAVFGITDQASHDSA